MIEGLHAAPWFYEKARRKEIAIDDCGRCMQTTTQLQRMSLGCGYEPAADGRVHLTVWQPPEKFYKGPPLTICAGYSATLPEVVEVAKARSHWKVGALSHVCEGEIADEALLDMILVYDGECSHLEAWLMTPAKDGGGGA